MTAVRIVSEIAPLDRVMVHRPGREVARMTQHELEDLLFDDILSPGLAQREHDLMVEILRGCGAEVLEVRDLLEAALAKATAAETEALVTRCCEQAGLYAEGAGRGIAETMCTYEPARLADALIAGLRYKELAGGPQGLARLRREQRSDDWSIALPPVPNLMFMRDPCMAIGERVVVGRMATDARAREPLLVSFALEHSGTIERDHLLFRDVDPHLHPTLRQLEGGDVLVLSEKVIFIGCSERTSAETIERLANEALFDAFPKLERVNVAMMPTERSVMHLDTILTHVDRGLFLGHAPLISNPGDRALRVARLERNKTPAWVNGTVRDVLRDELGEELEVVPCGGDDPLQQEREQWTDGANALCTSPGHIILYARNTQTIAALREHGFDETAIHMVQPPEQRRELIAAGRAGERTVFSFAGGELSRARGGGRCLTMSLRRQLGDPRLSDPPLSDPRQ